MQWWTRGIQAWGRAAPHQKGTLVARGPSDTSGAFGSHTTADGTLSSAELLEQCMDELELKSRVLDGLADGIIVHRPNGTILYANPAAATIYGYPIEDFVLIGKYEWVPPENRDIVVARAADLFEHGYADFESTGYKADHSFIRTEVHARLLELPRIGEVFVSVIQDVTERLAVQETIKHLAFHDSLTGLANRAALDEQVQMAMSSAGRHGDVVGVVYMDLDQFKPVNDEWGHAAGDVVLKTVADRLVAGVREYDTVSRVGGDEFLVLFPRLGDRDSLPLLGRKLQDSVAKPIALGDKFVHVTAKVGLATYHEGEAPDELVGRADRAMYRARSNGVPGWDVFGPDD
jgi:diguanylate cyclase (GGDEF)-like protein/PAS domain S-box-containing protein